MPFDEGLDFVIKISPDPFGEDSGGVDGVFGRGEGLGRGKLFRDGKGCSRGWVGHCEKSQLSGSLVVVVFWKSRSSSRSA